jgi:pimeloyl-ACP methyl ester carboxylesterase
VILSTAYFLYLIHFYFGYIGALLVFSALGCVFLVSRVYSMVQAFKRSRELGAAFVPRRFNRLSFYVLFTLIFLLLNIGGAQVLKEIALADRPSFHPFRTARAKAEFLKVYDSRALRWPVEAKSRMVDTSYGSTMVRVSGPEEGPPLVLLHGIGGSSLQWMYNVKSLSREFRTYAVDNIYDYGRSVYTRRMRRPDDMTAWLDELLTGLKLGKNINLIGVSYGGWITSQYALHFPERLDKIVLAAPVMTVRPLSLSWILRASFCAIPHQYFTRSFLNWLLEDLAHSGDANRGLMEDEAAASYQAIRSFQPKPLVAPTLLTDEDWQRLKVRALFLVGENEKIYSASMALQRLREAAPHIETRLIPDAGHDLLIVQADLVLGHILEFLKARSARQKE